MQQQTQPESSPSACGLLSASAQGSEPSKIGSLPQSSIINEEPVNPQNRSQPSDAWSMDGKRGRPRRDTLSPVAERFRWLILQLKGEGLSEPEIGSRIGFKAAYINAVVNWETSGRKSVGAEIPGMVKKGLGVDVDYFYDEYSGERPYKLYLLDAQREKARLAELDHKLADLRRELGNAAALRADDNVRTTEVLARLAAAVARIDQRMGRLEESSGLNQLSLPPEGSPEHEPVRKHGHGKNASVKPRKPHRG